MECIVAGCGCGTGERSKLSLNDGIFYLAFDLLHRFDWVARLLVCFLIVMFLILCTQCSYVFTCLSMRLSISAVLTGTSCMGDQASFYNIDTSWLIRLFAYFVYNISTRVCFNDSWGFRLSNAYSDCRPISFRSDYRQNQNKWIGNYFNLTLLYGDIDVWISLLACNLDRKGADVFSCSLFSYLLICVYANLRVPVFDHCNSWLGPCGCALSVIERVMKFVSCQL